jgi:LysM repeat protein
VFYRLFTKEVFFVVLILLFAISINEVNAGIFSFFDKDLDEERYKIKTITSQNMALLRAAVNIDPNPSKGGGDISTEGGALVPDSGPLGTIADIDQILPESDQISVYVVREGDSLSQIANMFNVSTNTIIWANDIKRGDLIHQGQTLVILPITGIRHTVAKGDTLKSIATKYKGDVEEIIEYNGFPENLTLSVGDSIIIPNGKTKVPVYSSSGKIVRGVGGPSYDSYYMRPVIGGRKSQHLHGYNAVDIAVPMRTQVFASAAGTVKISRIGWNGGYGNYIVISHSNGTQTLYAHNSQSIVSAGQYVVQGQVIAYSGSTGRSTGPHLHFEVRGAKNPF